MKILFFDKKAEPAFYENKRLEKIIIARKAESVFRIIDSGMVDAIDLEIGNTESSTILRHLALTESRIKEIYLHNNGNENCYNLVNIVRSQLNGTTCIVYNLRKG